MVRFLLFLVLLFLVIRFGVKLLMRLFGLQGYFTYSTSGRERPVVREERKAEEAEYEVIESHIRDGD
jgi:hypothetical protein